MTDDEVVGWPHRLDGHEFEQAPGDGEGQVGLICCSPWGHKQLDTTEATYHACMHRDGQIALLTQWT